MVRQNRYVQLLSETTGGRLECSLRYRELLRHQGFGHELGSAFIQGGLWGGMDLMRDTESTDFSARVWVEQRQQRPEIALARGGEASVHDITLAGEFYRREAREATAPPEEAPVPRLPFLAERVHGELCP
jgi:hypothetical protein